MCNFFYNFCNLRSLLIHLFGFLSLVIFYRRPFHCATEEEEIRWRVTWFRCKTRHSKAVITSRSNRLYRCDSPTRDDKRRVLLPNPPLNWIMSNSQTDIKFTNRIYLAVRCFPTQNRLTTLIINPLIYCLRDTDR